MAYDRRDGLSYLDDIPLKVASAFLPPPLVGLPAVLTPNEEQYFEKFQYDFSFEHKVLENIKEQERLKSCETVPQTGDTSDQDPATDSSVKPNVQNILSMQSDILLPKPKEILDKVSNADDQNNPKINLSDFENDSSSPFDYVLLQSLNDIEELYNVFGVNNKSSSDNNVNKDKTSISSGLNDTNVGSNVSKSMSFPLQNSDSGFENAEKYNMPCSRTTADRGHNVWSASLTFPKENCSVPSPVSDASAGEGLSRTFKLPEVPFLPSGAVRSHVVENGLPVLTSRSALRGCKSYSDIHNLSEHSSKVSSLYGRPSTPPTSAYSEIDDTKLSSLSVQVSEISSPGDSNCDNNSSPASGLPDPYDELTEDSRKFVDAIADMGFPRAQVSRTVKHLGADEKTVVEHLCQIQTLEESGYDCLEAEAALHLHDYNQDQAKQFLDNIVKFQDLGFEKNAVKKALIQNKNDWSKTIDALLS